MLPTRLDAYSLFHSGALALARAELQGIRIDVDYCQRKKIQLSRRIERLEDEFKQGNFYKHWKHYYKDDVNIDSNYQLSNLLYKVRKIEPIKVTDKGKGSTDVEALLRLDIPEILPLIEIRKLKKIDTYLDAYVREQVDGYVHAFFNLNNVRPGRSSSSNPNLQNTPRRDKEAMSIVRKALYPRPGHQLVEADFESSEVKVSACYNHDPKLLSYVRNPRSDMHRDMAIEIFLLKEFDKKNPDHKQLRQAAKNGFVFPEFYGDYYKSCAEYLACNWGKLPKGRWKAGDGIPLNGNTLASHLIAKGLTSFNKFTDHIEKVEYEFWNERFRVYNEWKDQWFKAYQQKGYFDTLTGYRCGGVMSKKEACNYPIQGSSFHCLLWCFIKIDELIRKENLDSRLVSQVHDSMVLDVHPNELEYICKAIKRVVEIELPEHYSWIIVPMAADFEVCDVDKPWSDKQSYQVAA